MRLEYVLIDYAIENTADIAS